jgi:hypothetical protein
MGKFTALFSPTKRGLWTSKSEGFGRWQIVRRGSADAILIIIPAVWQRGVDIDCPMVKNFAHALGGSSQLGFKVHSKNLAFKRGLPQVGAAAVSSII